MDAFCQKVWEMVLEQIVREKQMERGINPLGWKNVEWFCFILNTARHTGDWDIRLEMIPTGKKILFKGRVPWMNDHIY